MHGRHGRLLSLLVAGSWLVFGTLKSILPRLLHLISHHALYPSCRLLAARRCSLLCTLICPTSTPTLRSLQCNHHSLYLCVCEAFALSIKVTPSRLDTSTRRCLFWYTLGRIYPTYFVTQTVYGDDDDDDDAISLTEALFGVSAVSVIAPKKTARARECTLEDSRNVAESAQKIFF